MSAAPRWWQELPLVVVHLVVVASFARVYEDLSFFAPLAGVVLAAHLLTIATRRSNATPAVSVVVAVAGFAIVGTWALFGSTTTWGLPTTATWNSAGIALREAAEQYQVVIAPTAVVPGFQLAAAAALWLAVWFADWTARRLRAPLEALGPSVAVFAFVAVLGSGDLAVVSAGAYALSALTFLAVERQRTQVLRVTMPHRARTATARRAAAVVILAAVGGAALGPVLPGASSPAAVGWRAGSDDDRSRVTVSPMVELNKRLVTQSDLQVFEVRSPTPAYWRLTALDDFDGELWSSSGEFSSAGGSLSAGADQRPGEEFTQQIRIDALSTIWAPAAYEAVGVRSPDAQLRWDDESGTLIVESSQATSDGLTYEVTSRPPVVTPAILNQASERDPASIRANHTRLPDDFPDVAADLARQVTAEAGSRYDRSLALQDWFRDTFTYSLDVPAGHGDDALVSFLTSGEGYCEQFAGAFAAMARSMGIPARVAVGFTPGTSDPEDPTRYIVRGRNAHAWPEVYFPEVGWVPFEPTPGRGMPGAERYTGVAAQQAENGADPTGPTTAVPTSVAPATEPDESVVTTAPAPADAVETGAAAAPADADGSGSGQPWWWLGSAIALGGGVAIGAVRLFRERSRRGRGRSNVDRAWDEVTRHLGHLSGDVRQPSDTHQEYAERVLALLPDTTPDERRAVRRLADLVASDRWSPRPLDEAEQAQVQGLARQALTIQRPTAVSRS